MGYVTAKRDSGTPLPVATTNPVTHVTRRRNGLRGNLPERPEYAGIVAENNRLAQEMYGVPTWTPDDDLRVRHAAGAVEDAENHRRLLASLRRPDGTIGISEQAFSELVEANRYDANKKGSSHE